MGIEHVVFNVDVATRRQTLCASTIVSDSLELGAHSIRSSIPIMLRDNLIEDLRIECLLQETDDIEDAQQGSGVVEYCNTTGSVWHDDKSCLRARIPLGRETMEYFLQRLRDPGPVDLEVVLDILFGDDLDRVWKVISQRTIKIVSIEIRDTWRAVGSPPPRSVRDV